MNAKEKAIEKIANQQRGYIAEWDIKISQDEARMYADAVLSLPEVREYLRGELIEIQCKECQGMVGFPYPYCKQECEAFPYKQQAALLREAKEVLDKYGIHDLACALSVTIAPPGTKCTCGLEEALAKLEGK